MGNQKVKYINEIETKNREIEEIRNSQYNQEVDVCIEIRW